MHIEWDNDFIYNGKRSVTVACHFGDYQPKAACNLIDNQTLYYFDEADDAPLEEDHFTAQMIKDMEAKLRSYDRAIQSLSDTHADIQKTEEVNSAYHFDGQALSVGAIIAFRCESETFTHYYDFILDRQIALELSIHVQGVEYSQETKLIQINPYQSEFAAACGLLKAMRMAWYDNQSILVNPLCLPPQEAVFVNRLIQADQDCIIAAFLWDLRLAGHAEAAAMISTDANSDLYNAYAVEAMADFRSIRSGLALRASFERWFISARCRDHDRQIIQIMLGDFAKVTINNEDAAALIVKDIIFRLGSRPIGKNYLSQSIPNLMQDALYSEVRDRSNANFLWFVTFERKMAEMERNLHSDTKSEHETDQTVSDDTVYEFQSPIFSGADNGAEDSATLFILDHFRSG